MGIYDFDGSKRILSWLQERFGPVVLLEASETERRFSLARIDVTTNTYPLKVTA